MRDMLTGSDSNVHGGRCKCREQLFSGRARNNAAAGCEHDINRGCTARPRDSADGNY